MNELLLLGLALFLLRDYLPGILDFGLQIIKFLFRMGLKAGSATFIDSRGYERFSDSGRPVHRWVAGKKLGRPLRSEEVVHHINRDKSDNRPGNLWVFPNPEAHDRIHKIDAARYGSKASYKGFEE